MEHLRFTVERWSEDGGKRIDGSRHAALSSLPKQFSTSRFSLERKSFARSHKARGCSGDPRMASALSHKLKRRSA